MEKRLIGPSEHKDIMQTVAHLMGYENPIRIWGRSHVGNKDSTLVLNYFGAGTYFFMNDQYICKYNSSDAIGFYSKEDYGLEDNLIDSRTNTLNTLEEKGKAYIQDYNNRIVKGALKANSR
jgi:hypothetical protein